MFCRSKSIVLVGKETFTTTVLFNVIEVLVPLSFCSVVTFRIVVFHMLHNVDSAEHKDVDVEEALSTLAS